MLFNRIMCSVITLCLLGTGSAYANNIKPEVGIKLGVDSIKFKEGHGDKMFSKCLPQVTLFSSIKIHDFFGGEIGVFKNSGSKKATVLELDKEFGIEGYNDFDKKYSNKVNRTGMYLVGKGYLPINEIFSATSSAGISLSKINLESSCDQVGDAPALHDAIARNRIETSKNIVSPILGTGFECKINKRVKIIGEYVFNASKATIDCGTGLEPGGKAKLKNSMSYNLGASVSF